MHWKRCIDCYDKILSSWRMVSEIWKIRASFHRAKVESLNKISIRTDPAA